MIALSLSPLLASVIVRTYGWWVFLNREGAINDGSRALGLIDRALAVMPSAGAIVVGLAHSLLPYGVLTILSSLNGVNPHLERPRMSLGANRLRTFLEVTLPLSLARRRRRFLAGVLAGDQRLCDPGDPRRTGDRRPWRRMIYDLHDGAADWALGSAMGVLLVASRRWC